MTDSPPLIAAVRPTKRLRGSFPLVLSLLLAALLLGWFLTSFPVLDAGVWALMGRYPWTVGAMALGSVSLMTLISAAKWQMLLRCAEPELARAVSFDRLFAYTAASTALGQIVMPYIAGPAVRGAAMKSQHDAGFSRSAMLASYEQVFDVVVLLAGGTAALGLLLGGRSGSFAVAAFALVVVLVPASTYMLPDRFRPMRVAAFLPARWSTTRVIRSSVETGSRVGLDAPRLLGHLLALSALRYAILTVRTVGIGLFLLPLVPWTTVALGFGAVQLSALATLTPGNLGITELGWSALSVVTERATTGEFVAFALALRVSGLVASAVLALLAMLWLRRP